MEDEFAPQGELPPAEVAPQMPAPDEADQEKAQLAADMAKAEAPSAEERPSRRNNQEPAPSAPLASTVHSCACSTYSLVCGAPGVTISCSCCLNLALRHSQRSRWARYASLRPLYQPSVGISVGVGHILEKLIACADL